MTYTNQHTADFVEQRVKITTLADAVALRRKVIAAGHSHQVANGLVAWVIARQADEPDDSGAPTRSRYRKILREVGDQADGPPRIPVT